MIPDDAFYLDEEEENMDWAKKPKDTKKVKKEDSDEDKQRRDGGVQEGL